MKFAGGVLRWPEDVFWATSFAFFRAAWEGWAISAGVKKHRGRAPTREEYEAAKRAADEHERKKRMKKEEASRAT